MRRLNGEHMPPRLSMFDGFVYFDGMTASQCYIRISGAYRTYIQSQFEHPIQSPHQFVFDNALQVGLAEIRRACDGELVGLVDYLAIPSAIGNWEEVNAA